MNLTIHHLPDGTFAAEIPNETGESQIVFSAPYDDDAGRIDHYSVLARVLLSVFRIILPPINETKLNEPGKDTVPVKIA